MGLNKLKRNQKLILFDIDRTLITRSQGHEEAFSDAFKSVYGIDTNISIINYHGMTDQAIIIKVLKKNGLAENKIKPKIKKCMNVMIKSFRKRIQRSTFGPMKGVKKLLRELSRRNILMGLVTGNLEKIARGKMKKLGLNHYFPVGGFGSDDINRTKLVKLAIKRAKKKFNFKFNDNVFLVGDAPQDIKAGKDAGVKTIGVLTGIYSKKDLLNRGADYVLEDLTDINSVLNIIFRKENISILNKRNIKSGKLAKLIPEFYGLKEVIENNPWHNNEPVFDHTLSVLDNLGKIIHNSKKEIKRTLNKIVDKNSRKDLLYTAALFHDIGKKETMIDLDNGIKKCPGHCQKGAEKTEKILKRFNLSPKESKIITDIVRNHGLINDIIAPSNKNFRKEYRIFKKEFSKIYPELFLLSFADTIGSYLKKTKPAEFRHRINFYKKELKNLPPKKNLKSSNPKGSLLRAGGKGVWSLALPPAEPVNEIGSDIFKYTPPRVDEILIF